MTTLAIEKKKMNAIGGSIGQTGFDACPLSLEQRKQLGVEQYYSPFLVSTEEVCSSHRLYRIVKRSADVVCALLGLLVLSPVILAFLLAIYVEDPNGSPVFRQERIGRDGKPFMFYKMRSMCVDAEAKLEELLSRNEANGKAFKIKDDPRITKVGKIIRNTSIDELLQLVNIIKGDMSIVGPRPPLPREVALYNDYEMQRLAVTPGLTCFWQVHPERHSISFDDWVAMDLKYIQERSWWVDTKMVWKTVMLILSGAHD